MEVEWEKDQEPALLSSSPSSTPRQQVILSLGHLLSQSHSVLPHQNRETGCLASSSGGRIYMRELCKMHSVCSPGPKLSSPVEHWLQPVGQNGHGSAPWPFQKAQVALQPRNPTPRYLPRKIKALCPRKDLYTNIHSRFSHNSPGVESTCISINRRTGEDKDSVVRSR